MVDSTIYNGAKVGVFGLGKTGLSTIYSLKAGGARVIAWDDDASKRNSLMDDERPEFLALFLHSKILVNIEDRAWQNLDYIVLSPGVPLKFPHPHRVVKIANLNNIPIISDIEILYNNCKQCIFIGITGTNGKSTTTALIGHILRNGGVRCEVGGNIGIPVLDLNVLAADGCYVIEMSSYHLDLMDKMRLDVAVLLNITQDHIDRHGSFDSYIAAKKKIFSQQDENDVAVIGIDCPIANEIYNQLKQENKIGKIIPVSTERVLAEGVSIVEGILHYNYGKSALRIKLDKLPYLPGQHNSQNIAAAFAVSRIYQIEPEKAINAIYSFKGLRHRMQLVDKINNVSFTNDSKATNAESALKAFLCLDNIYWIAGGVAKEGGIEPLIPYFNKIKHAFLIGRSQQQFADILKEHNINYSLCGDLKSALTKASSMAFDDKLDNANVLLSPACASFDQWQSFEHRGDAFCELVEKINDRT
jgi:UDP-N-acetylmuramoylalanine--D-glutamate ligase